MKTVMPLSSASAWAPAPASIAAPSSSPSSSEAALASSKRRITLSPEGLSSDRPTKVARLSKAKAAALETGATAAAVDRLQVLCPHSHTSLPSLLSLIRRYGAGEENDTQRLHQLETACLELEDLLSKEVSNKDGTTLALFHCGGHLDILRALQQQQQQRVVNHNSTTILSLLRVLHLLCCRKGYYRVPEVLGVSGMQTSLVYAGAIDTIFATVKALEQSDSMESVVIQQAFDIIDSLLVGLSLSQIVPLGVPRGALNLVHMTNEDAYTSPTDPSLVVLKSVATLWNSLITEFQGVSDMSSWANNSSNDSPPRLLMEAQDRFAHAQEQLFCGGSTMTQTSACHDVTKALENVRAILSSTSDDEDSDDDDDDEHNKEN